MRTIYLDHNMIAIIGGRTRPDAERLEDHVMELVANGDKVALSAWNVLELSQSSNEEYIATCVELVERLQPVWLSNPSYVKKHELGAFLNRYPEQFPGLNPHTNPAFNKFPSQMWSTYGESVVGENFYHTIEALRKAPPSEELREAIRQTPASIITAREAIKVGRAKLFERDIQSEYFKGLLLRGAFDPKKAIGYLVDNTEEVLKHCPAVAVEHYLTEIRATENFRPRESDAADLQHATVGVAYCDHFVSDDKQLVEHCARIVKKTWLSCSVGRSLDDIPSNN